MRYGIGGEIYWHQRSRVNWVQYVGKNTIFPSDNFAKKKQIKPDN